MSTVMSVAEREEFLAGVHVGVLGVVAASGADVLAVPVWYRYEPGGDVVLVTGRDSLKARLIRAAGRFSLCAQEESEPYRYVSVQGPAVVEDDGGNLEEHRALAHRYLPPPAAEAYLAGTDFDLSQTVTIRMRPERWYSADFSKQAG
ncbi:pyridoxamine 5'-phosphate oxidase family protein [Allostreptomyces psammosilenae]|uniref:Nitroimidazol reductase NimA-like FMN-containing flavoprotein (Pyridoxamine 5'-phosphate oxidase superfamily) n=1 Tax=Allostreptomyces psammosilenae TaxID=1892865 RepID=A0A852ZUG2_9ACTN|nr:pyridoxamine 5'-phosphate oxidase family protein [Allostreptomyces psammosilenae]NYI06026.1 nitroimidazol reductase NimA-like FMN-containing flavoprotein (pyridoxamine 5'-phosphate oxidase superfamily) [Allostreptomyces psammosilenae]